MGTHLNFVRCLPRSDFLKTYKLQLETDVEKLLKHLNYLDNLKRLRVTYLCHSSFLEQIHYMLHQNKVRGTFAESKSLESSQL